MKTLQAVREDLAQAGKPVQTAQLYRYLRRFNLQPLTATRPKFYPDDTAARILEGIGIGKEGV